MAASPVDTLTPEDPGDDMQRRIRYQATSAAIWSLALYDEGAGLVAVYCELHEDVLFHKTNDRFVGTQVKTKLDHLGPYSSTDEQITHSIRRFVALEQRFPNRFDGFQIATNAGFWNDQKTGANLEYILACAASDDLNGSCPTVVSRYLTVLFPAPVKPKMSRKKQKSTTELEAEKKAAQEFEDAVNFRETNVQTARRVLKRVTLTRTCRMADARLVLIDMLPKCPLVGDRFHSELGRIADALISTMLEAGALAHESHRDRYLFLFDNADELSKCETIKGKRITCDRLRGVLESCISSIPTLVTNQPVSIADLPPTLRTMEMKMAAGGISIGSIELQKDLRDSTELLLARWFHQNAKQADERYRHLRTVVRTVAQEAYDNTFNAGNSFGQAMLARTRERLQHRYETDSESLFGCTYEHLLGMVAILTDDCTIWWSEKFAIPVHEAAT